ncbi:MAG: PKD domain-containing protein, partial [Croceitalea sp.]|nr:PKD domain-containing protein [Croceitalea sp.]
MKNVFKNVKIASIFFLAISFFGCEEDDIMLPKVTSGFTYTLNAETATVTFINISEEASSYEWDFGDGETSTLINPIKTYSESGTYTVTLEASNVAGASEIFEDQITIVILDQVTLPITFDDTNVNYEVTNFGGTGFEIVNNPDVSGSNDKTSNVGRITNSGAAFEGIFFDLGTAIDLTAEKSITMNFWSETPVDVLLK